MRKWAWLAVAIVVTFIGATFVDDCAPDGSEPCPPVCHFACLDGCTVAPIEPSILAPVATEACLERRAELASSPLELDFPPELIPPRA